MTGRRISEEAIAMAIAASGALVADVEKAAGMHRGELGSYLSGADVRVRSLVAASGLLGFSPTDLYREGIRG